MRILTQLMILLILSACAIGPDYEKPEIDTPETWRFTDAEASDVVNSRWWTQFDDPVLDQLIDELPHHRIKQALDDPALAVAKGSRPGHGSARPGGLDWSTLTKNTSEPTKHIDATSRG